MFLILFSLSLLPFRYEEPAFEVLPLAQVPSTTEGMGRLIKLKQGIPLETAVSMIKKYLNLDHLRLARPSPGSSSSELIESIAICAGSGGSVFQGVRASLFWTGEMSHHDVLAANANGAAVVLCEHTNTERGFLNVFQLKLQSDLSSEGFPTQVVISQSDRDPLVIV